MPEKIWVQSSTTEIGSEGVRRIRTSRASLATQGIPGQIRLPEMVSTETKISSKSICDLSFYIVVGLASFFKVREIQSWGLRGWLRTHLRGRIYISQRASSQNQQGGSAALWLAYTTTRQSELSWRSTQVMHIPGSPRKEA